MKKVVLIVSIIFGLLIILFILIQIYFYKISHDIEEYKYVVTETYDDFEIRQYETSLFCTVQLKTSNYENASKKGFAILGGYIFGDNEEGAKIPMTSPVSMTIDKEINMMFLIPKEFTKEKLPKPKNSNIRFIEIPKKKFAAINFSGWASQSKIDYHQKKLIKLLEYNDIKFSNNFLFLGYNSPFEIFFSEK
tara:strand:+ start:533 stop:1108 length:576 start_codon:yes stop_codon:yes gene_type:complete